MPTVDLLEFERGLVQALDEALREPVEITRAGRREFVLMSAEHYDWLKAAAKRAHRTADISDTVLAAVERS